MRGFVVLAAGAVAIAVGILVGRAQAGRWAETGRRPACGSDLVGRPGGLLGREG